MPDARPHDFSHSFVTIMRAALGESHSADLAAIAGHSVDTMNAIYTHSMGQAFDKVRSVVG
jgi:integrase